MIVLLLCLLSSIGLADERPTLPEGPGRELTMKLCNSCHGAELMLGRSMSEEGWSAVVINMAQRGVQASEDEFYEVVQYLTKYMKGTSAAKINVNKANAMSLEIGLKLTGKEVTAILEAREKAAFKTIDDLKKVVDAGKVEARKDRISF